MSLSRIPLELLLQQEFKQNEELKFQLIESGRKQIHKNLANRVFDQFTCICLIDKTTFADLTKKFNEVITTIHYMPDINDKDKLYAMLYPKEQEKLKKWELPIIQIACDDLFDKRTQKIRENISTLLHWQDWEVSLDSTSVICAYVGAIYQQIVSQKDIAETFLKNHHAQSAVFSYVNANSRTWVEREMKSTPPLPVTDSPTFARLKSFGDEMSKKLEKFSPSLFRKNSLPNLSISQPPSPLPEKLSKIPLKLFSSTSAIELNQLTTDTSPTQPSLQKETPKT